MRGVLRWLAKQAREVDRVSAVVHVPEARVWRGDESRGLTRRSQAGERRGRKLGRRCVRA